MKVGSHAVKSLSATQAVVPLSSGGVEFYGLVKTPSNAMGLRSVAADLGVGLGIRVRTVSSAAKGIASRIGLGKVRHVEVARFWVQAEVKNGVIILEKVDGKVNSADCLTDYVGREVIRGG